MKRYSNDFLNRKRSTPLCAKALKLGNAVGSPESRMDIVYQGILHFRPFILPVNGSQVLLDLQFSLSVPAV